MSLIDSHPRYNRLLTVVALQGENRFLRVRLGGPRLPAFSSPVLLVSLFRCQFT
jgi:hypothetical protein